MIAELSRSFARYALILALAGRTRSAPLRRQFHGKSTVPSTQSTSYRCSLPGLAGFASIPSPGTMTLFPQPAPNRQCESRGLLSLPRDPLSPQVVHVVFRRLALDQLATLDGILAQLA